MDVTDICKKIAKCVRDFCTGYNRSTILHIVEVLKGSENKQVLQKNHDKSDFHGLLKSWNKSDIERLLHMLVIEEYFREELIFVRDIPQAYLRIGPKIQQLIDKPSGYMFATKSSAASKTKALELPSIIAPTTSSLSSASSNKTKLNQQLSELEDKCYRDLLDICMTIASEREVNVASIFNIQALKTMAKVMPETKIDMLRIPHVTEANFEKYGKKLLEITQNYAAIRQCEFENFIN